MNKEQPVYYYSLKIPRLIPLARNDKMSVILRRMQ